MDDAKSDKIATGGKWAERLRGRGRMAVAVIGGVALAGFLGVSQPLSARIDTANERLTKASARTQLAGEVAELRRQEQLYNKRLSRGVDGNDWTNYLLEGIRSQNVKLIRMDPKDTSNLGPCKVLAWQIDVEGDLNGLGRVVAWLENGSRLVRIDRVVLQSAKEGTLGMSLLVKGLALDIPLDRVRDEKLKAEKKAAAAAKKADEGKIPQAIEDAMPKMPDAVKIPGMGEFKLPKAPSETGKKTGESPR